MAYGPRHEEEDGPMNTITTGKNAGRKTTIPWGSPSQGSPPVGEDEDREVVIVPPRIVPPRAKRRILKCGACGIEIEAGAPLAMSCPKRECPFFDNTPKLSMDATG